MLGKRIMRAEEIKCRTINSRDIGYIRSHSGKDITGNHTISNKGLKIGPIPMPGVSPPE
ncbi:hypothetical protein A2U01_0059151 [Trifolium medium]|uniref:Uncharacterized protein n=1 Tax=Trifolium medium TaxID=97028 RepID=A0A392RP96_9FABA|nr:hypothetical protein [Trifolium medium]